MGVDAVIVLANLMEADGTLNPESAARAAKAAEVFKDVGAGVLVTCGWAYRDDSDLPVADAFRTHIAARHGIPEARIVAERNSRDTVGDAIFTKHQLALPRGWKNILIVTSAYHVGRTRDIFDFIYGDDAQVSVVGVDVAADDAVLENEQRSLQAFRRTFDGINRGDTQGVLNRLREAHPFYNGAVYPRM